jgi:hypothetical protein
MIEFTDMYNDRHAIHYNDLPIFVIYHDKEIFIHESVPVMRYQPEDHIFYIKSDIVGKFTKKLDSKEIFPNVEDRICLESNMREDLESKMIDSFGKGNFTALTLEEKN